MAIGSVTSGNKAGQLGLQKDVQVHQINPKDYSTNTAKAKAVKRIPKIPGLGGVLDRMA